jgi:aldehyde:ferredoxin oxidoreductase
MSQERNENTPAKRFGYMGRVLWIDLGSEDPFMNIDLPDEYYEKFLSGYGLAAKIIFDRQKPNADALGPENILAIMSGLLTGTGALMSGRWMAAGKSPLTGTWGDANCGGHFSPEIKKTGYDGFFFVGRSKNPVYLLIDGERKELRDAKGLWGLDSNETEDALLNPPYHDDRFKVACIGTAGEKKALLSGIVTDKGRLAARSGLGAVMGSKNLKAICIRGDAPIRVSNIDAIMENSDIFRRDVQNDDAIQKGLSKYGTAGVIRLLAEIHDSPVKNWKGIVPEDYPLDRAAKISDEAVTLYQFKKYGCVDCPIICGGYMRVENGPFKIDETHKPEYETLCAFGTLLLSDDVQAVIKINDILNRAGIDTISCGAVVAWAFEAYEQGVITTEDTSGLELTWGNSDAAVRLVEMISKGEGIGDVLKDGIRCASRKYKKNSDAYAMNAGGQEIPMHDPRLKGYAGLGVAYEAEPTPGRHTSSLDVGYRYRDDNRKKKAIEAVIRHPLNHQSEILQSEEDPGAEQRDSSCMMDLVNGLGLCAFAFHGHLKPPLCEWINGATGWNKDFEGYLNIARRIKTLRHSFNIREGITPKDTLMTDRVKNIPPQPRGYETNTGPDFDSLKMAYYQAMGYDPITAKPEIETLKELGLWEVIEALYGKI